MLAMTKVGSPLFVLGAGADETDLLHLTEKREPPSLLEYAVRKKEVLAAKNVVEEVRRRVLHFRSESKAEKEKERHEREEELKVEEKSRAAAWAWYQHGNSGGPPMGGTNSLSSRGLFGCNVRKASRFKTEALKVGGNHSGRVEPRWDFETSLFDPYELDSVSKQIDHAFHDTPKSAVHPALPPSKITRSCSLRLSFPRSLCRSISDVVTQEEMALGVRKCECIKERSRRTGHGWSFRRISKAFHVLMHVPAGDVQPHHHDQQLHHHEHHHHHHQHEHEHHHHHHYSVRLKDGTHYGKSFSSIERVKATDPFPSYPKAR
ncbi:hypothetical protein MPTK1_2g15330 [Marchantia polymorpha subsp. ruderalis]|uniref:Uncharacterized protein n=1 Tax=Marchantia polymorpha TaxID=3197 RepID=A0A2R6WK22_MARPO|nr:hypothetical protein MARPO_0082s0032 [Marchantia polymorpha]BBN02433.1 hypothetical protein Mp_2g15330 [Marchantia polymorpha subsp. ruderalis]|eukprot:PTQ34181.1 hypothetical protein MARPO_0082s0032 [Marchantia polymorpha]